MVNCKCLDKETRLSGHASPKNICAHFWVRPILLLYLNL